jgi:hypothetical protein
MALLRLSGTSHVQTSMETCSGMQITGMATAAGCCAWE